MNEPTRSILCTSTSNPLSAILLCPIFMDMLFHLLLVSSTILQSPDQPHSYFRMTSLYTQAVTRFPSTAPLRTSEQPPFQVIQRPLGHEVHYGPITWSSHVFINQPSPTTLPSLNGRTSPYPGHRAYQPLPRMNMSRLSNACPILLPNTPRYELCRIIYLACIRMTVALYPF